MFFTTFMIDCWNLFCNWWSWLWPCLDK